MTGGIQHSNLFAQMPLFDSIYYEGTLDGKIRKFKAAHEDRQCRIFSLNVIRKEEDVIWDALLDMIKRSVSEAAFAAHGVYTLELLTINIHQEVKTFSPLELTQVIINWSRKLAPGQTCLIKYSSLYGLLQKMVHESWGKMVLKTTMEVFGDKPAFLDLLIKRLLKNFEFSHDPGILLLNDLSQQPLFDPKDTLQQERLKKVMAGQIPQSIEFPPEVYIHDRNGVRELLSGAIIK